MKYLSKLISKWMPRGADVAVDSHPRLSGIMDTINATLAHGPKTRLPKEFYDEKSREIIDRIGTEEWFSGYKESEEYRSLGIGSLLGDIVSRMIDSVQMRASGVPEDLGVRDPDVPTRTQKPNIRFGLSGCHDTTLAAIMASVGTMEGINGKWPPYTSHIAIEMFRKSEVVQPAPSLENGVAQTPRMSFWKTLLGSGAGNKLGGSLDVRKPISNYSQIEKAQLSGYYIRLRYNDRVLTIPGCKTPGNHWEGDESFCTLEAFKSIVDKFTPAQWKASCLSNLDEPAFPKVSEPAGH
jgi:acid phosphatase